MAVAALAIIPVPATTAASPLVRACGTAPGIACRTIWDLTHNTHLADITSVYVAGPVRLILRIAFVLLLAVLIRSAAQRLIRRVVLHVTAGPDRGVIGGHAGAVADAEAADAAAADDGASGDGVAAFDGGDAVEADDGAEAVTGARASEASGTGGADGGANAGDSRPGVEGVRAPAGVEGVLAPAGGASGLTPAGGIGRLGGIGHGGDAARRRVFGERRSQRATALASVLSNAASVTIFTVAGVIILGDLGLNLAPVLASAGVLGIAIGFGAQNLVKDFLAGVFMLLEDQYGVGDVVDVGSVAGTVEAVSLRITRLRDINGVVWHIRNGTIKRAGNETHGWARAVVDFPVPYYVPVAAARSALERAAVTMWEDPAWHDLMLDRPQIWGVEDVTASTVLIRVTARTAALGKLDVARELRERLKGALDAVTLAEARSHPQAVAPGSAFGPGQAAPPGVPPPAQPPEP